MSTRALRRWGPILLALVLSGMAVAQTRGSITLFGDVKIDQMPSAASSIQIVTIVLYASGGQTMIGRLTVPLGGRYRFNNLSSGEYELAVEAEMNEIARLHILVGGRPGSDFQQDLEFAYKAPPQPPAGLVSAADLYRRSSANESLFKRGQGAIDKKQYDEAVAIFHQVVESDPQDFQAWTELGTAFLLKEKYKDAEDAYINALKAKPDFELALLNLGRVRSLEKKFPESIEPLTLLVAKKPDSAEGNLLLGEAYLQIKKGSKAVDYLNEAVRLGRPEAHLRLAALYDAAKLKDRAADEYRQFLQKRPDYPDRKKLEEYISANGKK